jgi:ribosomal-protein-alanine N-acetyltransferase
MRLRRATAADLPALEAISREAGSAAHWSTVQWEAIFTRTAPPRLVWITEAEDGNAATGLLVALSGPEWELENIAVLLSARRQGAARALLGALVDEARAQQAERILLEVRASNEAAIALYKAAGFGLLGRRRDYYGNTNSGNRMEDALVMVLSLAG